MSSLGRDEEGGGEHAHSPGEDKGAHPMQSWTSEEDEDGEDDEGGRAQDGADDGERGCETISPGISPSLIRLTDKEIRNAHREWAQSRARS